MSIHHGIVLVPISAVTTKQERASAVLQSIRKLVIYGKYRLMTGLTVHNVKMDITDIEYPTLMCTNRDEWAHPPDDMPVSAVLLHNIREMHRVLWHDSDGGPDVHKLFMGCHRRLDLFLHHLPTTCQKISKEFNVSHGSTLVHSIEKHIIELQESYDELDYRYTHARRRAGGIGR